MRSALLQQLPNIFLHYRGLLLDLRVPKSLSDDPAGLKINLPGPVVLMLVGVTVLASVQFEGEFCFGAIEIHNVRAQWVFTTKLVAGKPTITQEAPHPSLHFGRALPQAAGTGDRVHERKINLAVLTWRAREMRPCGTTPSCFHQIADRLTMPGYWSCHCEKRT